MTGLRDWIFTDAVRTIAFGVMTFGSVSWALFAKHDKDEDATTEEAPIIQLYCEECTAQAPEAS